MGASIRFFFRRYAHGRQLGAKKYFFKEAFSELTPMGDIKFLFFQFIYWFIAAKNDFWTRGFQSFHQKVVFSVVQLNQITKKMNKQPSVDENLTVINIGRESNEEMFGRRNRNFCSKLNWNWNFIMKVEIIMKKWKNYESFERHWKCMKAKCWHMQ